MIDKGVLDITRTGLEDIAKAFFITEDLYEAYVPEILDNSELQEVLEARNKIEDWHVDTPLGGPGTVLNAITLYCLVRHYKLGNILETGVSGGFYTAFLMSALGKYSKEWWGTPSLTSIEISDNIREVGKLIPNTLRAKTNWNLTLGDDSLDYLGELSKLGAPTFDLYCHDSLHTMSHMLKEFMHFKKCEEEEFFIFIDDQDTDNFWRKMFQSGAYKKPGYFVNYMSGNESRLKGHLGGFLKYTKEIKFSFGNPRK